MVYCVYHLFCSKTYITTFTIIYIYMILHALVLIIIVNKLLPNCFSLRFHCVLVCILYSCNGIPVLYFVLIFS